MVAPLSHPHFSVSFLIHNPPALYLDENLESWKLFEEKRIDCAKNLDMADTEFKVRLRKAGGGGWR